MGKETIISYIKRHLTGVNAIYGATQLSRRPTKVEMGRKACGYAVAGIPACVGAVDGTQMVWNNCPYAYKGQYHNIKYSQTDTVGMEAWFDHELYIRSWFRGRCGTNNEKTLLSFSTLFIDILSGAWNLFLPMS